MTNLRRLLKGSKAFPLCIATIVVSCLNLSLSTQAQMISPQDIDLFRQLQQRSSTGKIDVESQLDRARASEGRPTTEPIQQSEESEEKASEESKVTRAAEEPLSRIEADYARRLGSDYALFPSTGGKNAGSDNSEQSSIRVGQSRGVVLRQFGYEVFDRVTNSEKGVTGRMPTDYILGVGDELVITLHGATQGTYVTNVDREGRVALPDLGLLNAAGQTFGQFRENLQERAKSSLVGTEAFVSVGSLRQITVYVMGEVERPGVHRMTSLSSVLDALSYAGGVKKSGSLRRITLARNGTKSAVDLYAAMQGTAGSEHLIHDGDRILVPVIGKTIAAVGEVIRPGIYELGGKNENAKQVIKFAGGPLRPTGYFVGLKRFEDSGRQSYSVLDQNRLNGALKSGDILSIQYQEDIVLGSIRLEGHVRTPGERPLAHHPTMQSLLSDVHQLGEEPYLPFALLETTDVTTRARHYRPIDLGKVLNGKVDYSLTDRDKLIVLGTSDVQFLSSPKVRRTIQSGKSEEIDCPGLTRLAQTVADSGSQRFASAVRWASAGTSNDGSKPDGNGVKALTENLAEASSGAKNADDSAKKGSASCPATFANNEHLLSYLLENVVAITGSVTKPGIYPITQEGSLSLALSVAGGLSTGGDRSRIELTSFRRAGNGLAASQRETIDLDSTDPSTISVQPRSSILVAAVPDDQEPGVITLKGEFVRPGPYTMQKGEALSSVIERAGGLTRNAYPYGAVFTRKSVKEEQTEGLRRSIRDLRTALAGASLKPRNSALNLQAAIDLADSLEGDELPGRFVVEADPAVLAAQPALDVLVEAGDTLFIPKRPTFVSLAGALLNPGTVQFNPGARARDYIGSAGGYHETADKGRVFIVLPNGSARSAPRGKWSISKPVPIPPGSTIVVPIESSPFDWLTLTRDLTQIFSQLALAAASLSVINN